MRDTGDEFAHDRQPFRKNQLLAESRAIQTEDIDDSGNRLEEDPYKATPEEEQDQDSLEKDELSKPPKK